MNNKKLNSVFQSQPILRYLSSVKLAVPLLLILAVVACAGTLVESRYNTAYAKWLIYDSWWMQGLLALLWINILFAALSRYPYKAHHLGFVITHLGLLLLLIGSMQTKIQGIDGQLRVVEGAQNSRVFLSDLTLELIRDQFSVNQDLSRPSKPLLAMDLLDLNQKFAPLTVLQLLPFAEKEPQFVEAEGTPGDNVVSFLMRSPMFQVSEELHSRLQPELQMGPATIRLVTGDFNPARFNKGREKRGRPKPQLKPSRQGTYIEFTDAKNPQTVKRIAWRSPQNAAFTVGDQKIRIKQFFERAAVVENKIMERPEGPFNPAVELEFLGPDGLWARDVRYEKFADFTVLNSFQPKVNIKIQSGLLGSADEANAHTAEPMKMDGPGGLTTSGNLIEFYVNPQSNPPSAHLVLSKNGDLVLDQKVREGDTVATPWMGMKISLGTLRAGVTTRWQLKPVPVLPRQDIPPAGIHLRSPSGDEIAILEGEVERIPLANGEVAEVYFGRNYMTLPFTVRLEKFKKQDYPGSETPMSFSSDVTVLPSQEKATISMNEPLKHQGYTLYQASYELGPQSPPASIFSVNRDPGRFLKYLGSIVLSIGIIVFTLMRSRFYKRKFS